MDSPATTSSAVSESKGKIWTGRILTAIVILFSLFDGITKLIKDPHVLKAMDDLAYPPSTIVLIGVLMLVCAALYAIPQTAVLGAVLLTGYLGGAVASNVRVSHPAFECFFPVIFGIVAWAGLFLREPRLWALMPLRK